MLITINNGKHNQGEKEMIVSTLESVPGREIKKVIGLVRGNTVRAKNFARDIGSWFKSLAGGEIKSYTEMLTEAREESLNRMCAAADAMGANAVIGVRFTTSGIMGGAAEVLTYGTAVVV